MKKLSEMSVEEIKCAVYDLSMQAKFLEEQLAACHREIGLRAKDNSDKDQKPEEK